MLELFIAYSLSFGFTEEKATERYNAYCSNIIWNVSRTETDILFCSDYEGLNTYYSE